MVRVVWVTRRTSADRRPSGKFNLVASAGTGPEGLVLSGHTDTVPYDEARWSSDPSASPNAKTDGWPGHLRHEGLFAVALKAISDLDLSSLKHPLILVATADEESSMCGAKALVDTPSQTGAACGDRRTDRDAAGPPAQRHRHGGDTPYRTFRSFQRPGTRCQCARRNVNLVMAELIDWRSELQQRYRNPLFAVDADHQPRTHPRWRQPQPHCAHCELHFDIRPLPGMDLAELRGEIDRRIGARLQDSGLRFERVSLFEGIPAMETPAQSPIIQAAESLTGYAAGAVAFGTEGPYLNALGMQTVIMGPGSIEQAHQPDEFLALEQIEPAKRILRGLIRRFCMT